MANAPVPEEVENVAKQDQKHHQTSSSLSDFTIFEIQDNEIKEQDPVEDVALPMSIPFVVADPDKLNDHLNESFNTNKFDFEDDGTFRISDWSGKRFYSDYIKAGLEYKKKQNPEVVDENIVMLFESPSSSATDTTFHNASKFKVHDWPPPKSSKSKGILGPNRYASMNGGSFPVFLRDGKTPTGLMEHWESVLPGFARPSFANKIDTELDIDYAYLPVEQLKYHVNDPQRMCNGSAYRLGTCRVCFD
jgi:hypothetical protein